jgi:hypothetical protein
MTCRSPCISGSTTGSWRSFSSLSGWKSKREGLAGGLASPRQAALPIAGANRRHVRTGFHLLPDERRRYRVAWVGDPYGGPTSPSPSAYWHSSRPEPLVGSRSSWLRLPSWMTWGRCGNRALLHRRDRVGRIGNGGPHSPAAHCFERSSHPDPDAVSRYGCRALVLVHESGVQATIAGAPLAFAIPTRTRIAVEFSAKARALLDYSNRRRQQAMVTISPRRIDHDERGARAGDQ